VIGIPVAIKWQCTSFESPMVRDRAKIKEKAPFVASHIVIYPIQLCPFRLFSLTFDGCFVCTPVGVGVRCILFSFEKGVVLFSISSQDSCECRLEEVRGKADCPMWRLYRNWYDHDCSAPCASDPKSKIRWSNDVCACKPYIFEHLGDFCPLYHSVDSLD
jgi:hypothetical protein